jgi:dTDP-4-amino-4,6-dideoxygalactose transaminase
LPGEFIAAFLWAQMEAADNITRRRLSIMNDNHNAFQNLEKQGKLHRPIVPFDCDNNAHMYYLLISDIEQRTFFKEKN